MVCMNLACAQGLETISQKFVISMRIVSKLNSAPVGYIIQALATRIHRADRFVPRAMRKVTARWPPLERRFQPKKNRPMKVDSMKKAIRPSIASGAPKMSPT